MTVRTSFEADAPVATGSRHWRAAVAIAITLGFLWYRLIDHLHVEWSLNPQYHFGWAVPFLCVYLAWRRVKECAPAAERSRAVSDYILKRALEVTAILAAVLYAPTRLIEEANPEWRLVSWALALEVIVITLFLARLMERSAIWPWRTSIFSLFPVLFFLVAVPWPTIIEGPLIQGLSRVTAASAVELLGWAGVPALEHGNIIEVKSGMVGIDEACSGIRSVQATLMIGLFFGEYYRLRAFRRLGLCVAGFGFAFFFNVARTTLLTWIAARQGISAAESWHDPAGVAILVGCFVAIWTCARAIGGKCEVRRAKDEAEKCEGRSWGGENSTSLQPLSSRRGEHKRTSAKDEGPKSSRRPSPRSCSYRAFAFRPSPFALRPSAFVLLGWLVLVEVGTECWYRWHERELSAAVTWRIELPQDNPTFRFVPLSERTRQFLRYDEVLNGEWEAAGRRCQAIFFRWEPGRTAVHLAKGHTPEVCLTAAGNRMTWQSELRTVSCQGIELPIRVYRFESDAGPLHVLYCLWRDRAATQRFGTDTLTYWNRLSPVLAGTRLTGQRSVEIALWGCPDERAAEADLERQLQTLVRR